MAKLNKGTLTEAVKNATGLKNSEAEAAVQAVLDTIVSTLRNGDEAGFVGFGTFSVGTRAKHEGTNPQTGEKMVIPAKKYVRFRASKAILAKEEKKKSR